MYTTETIEETPTFDEQFGGVYFSSCGLPDDVTAEMNGIADARPTTDADVDRMWAAEMENRDRAAASPAPAMTLDEARTILEDRVPAGMCYSVLEARGRGGDGLAVRYYSVSVWRGADGSTVAARCVVPDLAGAVRDVLAALAGAKAAA